jgi:hypothetical protein
MSDFENYKTTFNQLQRVKSRAEISNSHKLNPQGIMGRASHNKQAGNTITGGFFSGGAFPEEAILRGCYYCDTH